MKNLTADQIAATSTEVLMFMKDQLKASEATKATREAISEELKVRRNEVRKIREGEKTIADYRVNIEHEACTKRRSPVFETIEEARTWAQENLNPQAYASPETKKYARITRTLLSKVVEKEYAFIKGRPEGKKNYIQHLETIKQD